MEWFVLAAPVPTAVDFNVGAGVMTLFLLLVACVPVLLVVRNALGLGRPADEAPRLRVIEGGKELKRRAA